MKKPNKTGLFIVLMGTVAVVGIVATRVLSRTPRLVAPATPATMVPSSPTVILPAIRQEAGTGRQAMSDVVVTSLLPTGFEPAELTHPEGKFLFGVNNRTGLSDLTFQLVHESGRQEGRKRVLQERIWRKVIDLKPGRYLIQVTGHPEWQCQMTITAR